MLTRLVNRFPALAACTFYALAVVLAFNRIFSGMVLLPELSDQRGGYPPRLFAAEYFRENGALPEWSPYLFSGFPFISNTGFGDTFFPTALLRLIFPVDVGMAVGLMVFVFLAGVFTFLFLRGLKLSWGASFVGGAAYMFSGMVVSLVSPGHDGKLYVTAMLPLALLFLYKGTKLSDWRQYLYFGVVVGLCLLSPHFQATYYLLTAVGFFWLFMTFFSGERSPADPWWRSALLFAGGLAIGFAVAAIQLLPFIEYLPFSARAAEGSISANDWIYATRYSLPPEEIIGLFLPGFNSVSLYSYFGQNPLKFHSDYFGAVVVLLALASFKLQHMRKMAWFFVFLAIFSLLFAMGAHTPFYSIPYKVLPYIAKTRAPAVIFFLASLSMAVFAAMGTEYLLGKADDVSRATQKAVKDATSWVAQIDRGVLYGFLALVVLALLAAAGAFKPLAESIAQIRPVGAPDEGYRGALPGKLRTAGENYELFVRQIWITVLLATGAVALLVPAVARRLGRETVALYLGLIVLTDLWSLERNYIRFSPRASEIFAPDEVVTALKADTTLFRVMPVVNPFPDNTGRPYGGSYGENYFMVHRIRTALGYNGFEIHSYDELLGGKNSWGELPWQSTTMYPRLWQLLGVKYVVMTGTFPSADTLALFGLNDVEPLFREFANALEPVGGELRAHDGGRVRLLRVREPLPFAYLVPQAWRVDAEMGRIVASVISPQFDARGLLIVPGSTPFGLDSVTAMGAPISNPVRSSEPRAGSLRFELERPAERDAYLYVAENYYPAWKATVDGVEAPVVKAQVSLMAVPVKAGARVVELNFSLSTYRRGAAVTLVTVLVILGIAAGAWFSARRNGAARSEGAS